MEAAGIKEFERQLRRVSNSFSLFLIPSPTHSFVLQRQYPPCRACDPLAGFDPRCDCPWWVGSRCPGTTTPRNRSRRRRLPNPTPSDIGNSRPRYESSTSFRSQRIELASSPARSGSVVSYPPWLRMPDSNIILYYQLLTMIVYSRPSTPRQGIRGGDRQVRGPDMRFEAEFDSGGRACPVRSGFS
jgi:hypothetical protein